MGKSSVQTALDRGATNEELVVLVAAGHVAPGSEDVKLEFEDTAAVAENGFTLAEMEERAIAGVAGQQGPRTAAELTQMALETMSLDEIAIVEDETRAATIAAGITVEEFARRAQNFTGTQRMIAAIKGLPEEIQ